MSTHNVDIMHALLRPSEAGAHVPGTRQVLLLDADDPCQLKGKSFDFAPRLPLVSDAQCENLFFCPGGGGSTRRTLGLNCSRGTDLTSRWKKNNLEQIHWNFEEQLSQKEGGSVTQGADKQTCPKNEEVTEGINADMQLRQDPPPPPWFEFLVIFDFFAPWYRKSSDASSVKISLKNSKEKLVKCATEVARLHRASTQSCTQKRPSPKVQWRSGDLI